VCGRERIDAEH